MLMATLTDIRKHSIVHPAALIPRNCRLTNHCTLCSLTNAGCNVPLQNQSKALPPVCLHSGLRSSLRCAQLLHTLIKYLSSSRSPSAKRFHHQWHKHTVCMHHCLVLPDLLRLTRPRREPRIRISTATRSEEHTSELQSLM